MLSRSAREWVSYYGFFYGLAGFLMDRLLRYGILKYDRIISDSSWMFEELRKYPRISKIASFVPNGVDVGKFSPVQRGAAHNGTIRLLSVGRIVHTKGFRYAIEAMAHLKNDFPNLRLTIVGNGPLKEELIKLAITEGVGNLITFAPPVAYDRMPQVYGQHDFFLMPSLWEGLPVSLIEAMASNLPIIATRITAITSVLDDGSAFLCSKESSLDLAEKLRSAIANPDEAQRRAKLAYEISKNFSWENVVQKEIVEA